MQKSDYNTIAQRHILFTKCIGKAWKLFCTKHQELIVTTFRKLGLTLLIDGFCDHKLLSIKGMPNLKDLVEIGDWQHFENSIRLATLSSNANNEIDNSDIEFVDS